MVKGARPFLVLIAVCALGLFIFARDKSGVKVERPSMGGMPDEMKQKILSFELANYAQDGSKKWKLKGDSADIFAKVVNLDNISMETYDTPRITLTALNGAYDRTNEEITLFNDVIVLTADGTQLNTEYLKWDSRSDTITTDRHVRIVRSDVVADGEGALAYPQMKRIILNKNVKVILAKKVMTGIEMNFNSAEPEGNSGNGRVKTTITCKGPLGIDYEKNTAVFEDDVLVQDNKGKIHSDRMEAFLNPETKSIVKAVADGNVKVERGGDSTYSQQAIYTTADEKIILMGKPRIVIHSTKDMDKIERELEGL